MPNPKRGLGGNELDEKIIQIGLTMRMAGFGPMTRDEVKALLEKSDGGLTPITKAESKGAIPNIPKFPGGHPEEGQVYKDFLTPGSFANSDVLDAIQGRRQQNFEKKRFMGSRRAVV